MEGGDPARFRTGESVVYRDVDESRQIRSVVSARVVQDEEGCVVLWLPLGAPSMKPALLHHTPGTPRRWVEGNWSLRPSTWRWAELLVIARKDEMRATWVRWSADRSFQGWAVNMQSPWMRTPLGFDYCDHQLDILVNPDRSWRWKDQDELQFAVECGRMTRAQADRVRAEGARAVSQIERNESPFADPWQHWTPDESWSTLSLVSNWDDLSMYAERTDPARTAAARDAAEPKME